MTIEQLAEREYPDWKQADSQRERLAFIRGAKLIGERQKLIYDYVMANAKAHFLEQKQLYTAHITLFMDYQRYGVSEYDAKDTLAKVLCLTENEAIADLVASKLKGDEA